jgi:hypothetical protein
MSLQVSEEKFSISTNGKPDLGGSGLLGDLGKIRDNDDVSILPSSPNLHKRGFVSTEENFLKLMRSEKVEWLQSTYPNAFLLLIVISMRARRSPDINSGLEGGDALIDRKGTSKAAGITEDQFRYALDQLVRLNLIEIVFNPKVSSPQKRPIKVPIKCMVVNLLNSDVCDINRKTFPITFPNESPSIPHKQERKEREESKKKKKLKEKVPFEKKEYRENVRLSEKQHADLLAAHGELFLNLMLDELSSYKSIHGKEYDSDYHTMVGHGWVLRKCKEVQSSTEKPKISGSIREQILKRFSHGKFYREAECFINEDGIAFHRGMTHKQVKFKEFGFWDQFNNMLQQFGIQNE